MSEISFSYERLALRKRYFGSDLLLVIAWDNARETKFMQQTFESPTEMVIANISPY